MNKLIKNITKDNWQEAANTKNEQREQLLEEVVGDMRIGRYSALIKHDIIDDYCPDIKKKYPVDGVTLKIFFTPVDNPVWSAGFSIEEASVIQNIFSFKGLAPRIYDLIRVKDEKREYIAQVTKDLGEYFKLDESVVKRWYNENVLKTAQNNFISISFNDINQSNLVNGKWVDFQYFKFSDKAKYEQELKKFSEQYQTWQKNTYQAIPLLDIKGVRDESRMSKIDVDFEGKKVLDLGCSGGEICNMSSMLGADWVVGIDLPEVVEAARLTSNYLKNFNIEYLDANLNDPNLDLSFLGKFDIIFHFSMYQHIGLQPYIERLMDGQSVLFFEGNPYKPIALLRPELEKVFKERFTRIEYLGNSSDFGARPIYKLQK